MSNWYLILLPYIATVSNQNWIGNHKILLVLWRIEPSSKKRALLQVFWSQKSQCANPHERLNFSLKTGSVRNFRVTASGLISSSWCYLIILIWCWCLKVIFSEYRFRKKCEGLQGYFQRLLKFQPWTSRCMAFLWNILKYWNILKKCGILFLQTADDRRAVILSRSSVCSVRAKPSNSWLEPRKLAISWRSKWGLHTSSHSTNKDKSTFKQWTLALATKVLRA